MKFNFKKQRNLDGYLIKINSMKLSFYKTGELKGSSYVKIPLRSNASINIKNNDKDCFSWSLLASLHPCENDHPNRVSNYIKNFNELIFQSFVFTNGFKYNGVHKFNELNNLSVDIFELVSMKLKLNGNII